MLVDGHDMSGSKSDGTVVAVVIVAPPGSPSTMDGSICEELAIMYAAGYPPKDDSLVKHSSVLDRMKALEITLAKIHQRVMDQCTEKSENSTKPKSNLSTDLHVAVLACDPGRQGSGCGSTLLQFIGRLADADGVPSYLETTGERHEAFYSKKGGYSTVERTVVEHKNLRLDVNGGVAAMVRPPQQGRGS